MSNDIVKFRDIISESFTTYPNLLLEAPFWNRAPTGRAAGEQKRNNLIKKMTDAWNEWLGMTNLEGTQRDMINFLISKVGFSKNDTARILDIADAPIVQSNDEEQNGNSSETQPEQKNTNQQETPEEPKKERSNGYMPIISPTDYDKAYHNIDFGLSKKNKTNIDNDEIQRSFEFLATNFNKIPDDELESVDDIMQSAADYFSKLPPASKYYYNKNNITSMLFGIQQKLSKLKKEENKEDTEPHTNSEENPSEEKPTEETPSPPLNNSYTNEENPLMESDLLDQKLSDAEISEIFSDAASYAYANNLIGNKNYARANGVDVDSGTSSNSRSSNSQSKPAAKAEYMSDFASKVFGTAVNTGGIDKQDIAQLRGNSKTSWESVNKDDYPDYARVGWAFLRSLGR